MSESSSAVSPEEVPAGVDSHDVSKALEERYDRILREHGLALRRVAAIYEADPARREDLFQDVCLALWQALPRFRGDCSERTFAFRIAHNRGLSHGWRARSAPAALEEAGEIPDTRRDPESELCDRDRRERLREAVRRLPPVARQVVALSLEGLSHREIGEVLGVTENNVAVRLTRARKLLRQILESKS
ncbi:MAG TPA: sigma-70 family RNA polymerase sigma factor [Thermoanaerobaculia bacterium]|nr:sigma-70 family RNA polymerase sigma factor [Thermoanaerobaculia bacterium]